MADNAKAFIPLRVAILTVSDSRNFETDTSGAALESLATAAGHRLADRQLCRDDIYAMRAIVSAWIADPVVDVVITTGGTGMSDRDSTPEALAPLFDRPIEGFGELFRQLSFEEIGTSTIQSRAIAGLANRTLVFCVPGSTGACRTAWNRILAEQLDARHRPCNFVCHTGAAVGC
ncbi:molybdenum cofactor biosynthesis protein B [Marinihelvus fidelis]|uniref:Molybdenum cofactor biosynthesis protein B n=1 Tax=Marinihelvus fidelis TaxID=2613842 RepID=A0A5N0TF62_9GAMM|nr:molybdenum cofactor biosynthesis protein B [Marinihelvus fidelis]KAA9132516.1 molybdenum cofactor biosynthesis protein B [Marinihelvus fidelis]